MKSAASQKRNTAAAAVGHCPHCSPQLTPSMRAPVGPGRPACVRCGARAHARCGWAAGPGAAAAARCRWQTRWQPTSAARPAHQQQRQQQLSTMCMHTMCIPQICIAGTAAKPMRITGYPQPDCPLLVLCLRHTHATRAQGPAPEPPLHEGPQALGTRGHCRSLTVGQLRLTATTLPVPAAWPHLQAADIIQLRLHLGDVCQLRLRSAAGTAHNTTFHSQGQHYAIVMRFETQHRHRVCSRLLSLLPNPSCRLR